MTFYSQGYNDAMARLGVVPKTAGMYDFRWHDPAAGSFERPPTKQEFNQDNARFRGGMTGTLGALGALGGSVLGTSKFDSHPVLGGIGGGLAGGAVGGLGGYGLARLINKIEGEPKEYWKGQKQWFEEHPELMAEHADALISAFDKEHGESK